MLHDSTVLFVSILVTSSSQTIIFVSFLLRDYSKKKLKDLFFVTASHPVSQRYHLLSRCLCFSKRELYFTMDQSAKTRVTKCIPFYA
mmetsp:Transcript_17143/g.24894  ORF Transcript_17143/g.24894 Transcript_17143/m.24894 type:complete len:87 (-) Transcript_17143:404-664(-)